MIKYLIVVLFGFIFLNEVQSQWIEQELPAGFDYKQTLIDTEKAIFIYALKGVFVSYDHGENFIKTSGLPSDITLGKFIELDDKSILFRDHNDLYKFDKTNNSWSLFIKSSLRLINIDQSGRAWYCGNQSSIYYTDDLGQTYFNFIDKLGSYSNIYDVFGKFKPDFNIHVYHLSPFNEIRKVKDNGEVELLHSFKNSNKPFLFVNKNSGTLFITCGGGFCRSVDGISLDTIEFSGTTKPYQFTELKMLNDSRLLLKTDRGFYLSNDDGLNWKNTSEDWDINQYPVKVIPDALGFGDSEDTIITINNDCLNQGLYKSVDFGASWVKKSDKNFYSSLIKIEEDKLGNQYVLSCSDTTTFIKKYNENEWTKLEVKYNGKYHGVYDFAISNNDEIYLATKYGIFKSEDYNSTFTLLNVKNKHVKVYKLVLSNNGFVYLIGNDSTSFVSADKGLNWKTIKIGIEEDYNMQVDNFGNLYYTALYPNGMGTGGQLALKSYKYQYDTVQLLKDSTNCPIEIADNGLIYFFKFYSQSQPLCTSSDGFNTYTLINNKKLTSTVYGCNTNILNTIFTDLNGALYLANYKSIYKSEDGGKNFYYWNMNPISNSFGYFHLSRNQTLFLYDEKLTKLYRLDNKVTSGTLVKGSTFEDLNKDCIWNNLENVYPNTKVEISGTKSYNLISGENGEMIFRIDEGNYNISTIPPNNLYEGCTVPLIINQMNQNDTLKVDVGIKIKEYCPYLTVQVQNSVPRRCFDNTIYVHYQNDGTATANNVDLKITLDNYFQFLSSSINPTSQTGQELTYNISQVLPGESGDIIIYTNLSCDASNGETVCINAQFNPENKCNTVLPKLDNYTKCDTITGSYDPNNKRAFVNGSPSNGIVDMNQDIEYLIRFQNTGTDTAFRVVVTDQITENFDLSSIKILNYSHPVKIKIDEPRKVSFIFDDIMLPDSNINESASHGFISFKISPKKDLPYGTTLNNYADIFFDYNDPIRTDTAYLIVDKETSTGFAKSLSFSYYPNPTHENLNIYLEGNKNNSFKLKVLNILGKVLYHTEFKGNYHTLKSCKSFNPGIYLLHIEDNNGRYKTASFVVE